MKTMELLEEFYQERNITWSTKKVYENSIRVYMEVNEMSLEELLEEAEEEEEAGLRWKHRSLRKRLIRYQNYLLENYNYSTTIQYYGRVKTFYHHHNIEIHNLPPLNKKQAHLSEPIHYQDLPTKEVLKKAYDLANPVMKAIILFSISTGCGKTEILNFTRDDYYNWIDPYNPQEILEKNIDIVPTIYTTRQKTNHHYFTFATPESIKEIGKYLETRDDNKPVLFKIQYKYMSILFNKYNNALGLGRKNNCRILRSHMLRKFHASQLSMGENRLTLDEIDSLQGRVKQDTRKSYYYSNPEDLKKKYIRNMDKVTILDKVHTITVDSPEVEQLKRKAAKIDELEKLVKQIMERSERG